MCGGGGRGGGGVTLGKIVQMDARARPPWYTPSIFGEVDEAAVKVCGAGGGLDVWGWGERGEG